MTQYLKHSRIEGNIKKFVDPRYKGRELMVAQKYLFALATQEDNLHMRTLNQHLKDNRDIILDAVTQYILHGINIHLIQNAIDSICLRFGQHVPTYVCALDMRTQYNDEIVRFEFEDNGIGIDTKLEPLLFSDKQYSTKKKLPPELSLGVIGGMNGGLRETRAVVESYEGHMRFQNKGKNEGGIFGYEIPIKKISVRVSRLGDITPRCQRG